MEEQQQGRPFVDFPGTVQNTWAEGLNPRYVPMPTTQAEMFVTACLLEAQGKDVSEDMAKKLNELFLIKILDSRIEAFKLPISFSMTGKMAVVALTDRPGSVVVLLIDCLNAYEGKTITTKELSDLYPLGFYDENTLMRYVDEYLKPRDDPDLKHPRVKWSEVYVSKV